MKKIKVLVVDDSAFIRQMLTQLLKSDAAIDVVGAAPNPLRAREMIKELNPDVLTLDVEMPEMDGLAFLEKLMRLRPMPVVMVSSLTEKGAEITLQALELGAVDFIAKPKIDLREGLEGMAQDIISKVKYAATARLRAASDRARPAVLKAPVFKGTEKIIAIGSSTGGVEALIEIITALPQNSPAVVIAQHMPANFTTTFAARLDKLSAMKVHEANNGARILPGHVYLAPGGFHLLVERSGANYLTKVTDAVPPMNGHRPSVDALFHSVAQNVGQNAVGAILTGMGNDGAKGLLDMRQQGAQTFGQDEHSCVVYGMPKIAMQLGAVGQELPLTQLAAALMNACGSADERALIRI
jgi:two-component system, chemotaxis family, protein-glutamate methylesterase/glutaminase